MPGNGINLSSSNHTFLLRALYESCCIGNIMYHYTSVIWNDWSIIFWLETGLKKRSHLKELTILFSSCTSFPSIVSQMEWKMCKHFIGHICYIICGFGKITFDCDDVDTIYRVWWWGCCFCRVHIWTQFGWRWRWCTFSLSSKPTQTTFTASIIHTFLLLLF